MRCRWPGGEWDYTFTRIHIWKVKLSPAWPAGWKAKQSATRLGIGDVQDAYLVFSKFLRVVSRDSFVRQIFCVGVGRPWTRWSRPREWPDHAGDSGGDWMTAHWYWLERAKIKRNRSSASARWCCGLVRLKLFIFGRSSWPACVIQFWFDSACVRACVPFLACRLSFWRLLQPSNAIYATAKRMTYWCVFDLSMTYWCVLSAPERVGTYCETKGRRML